MISHPGEYELANDVTSPGTCFGIQADNVTLNLNSHTITYATAEVGRPVFAVLGVACWDPDFGAGNPCGGSFNNLKIYGGAITQGAHAAAFSHGVRLGQGGGSGLKVDRVTFDLNADSSIPIYTTYAGTKSEISHNTISNRVTTVRNRHQLQGQSIKFADSSKTPGPAAIFGNHITGGVQGGIFSSVVGTRIFENSISQKGTYTNDFSIYAWANSGEVFQNTINPVSGRGIQIAGASNGERVHDNNIVVIEVPENREYGGCQVGGAYGIQFDDVPQNGTAFRNTVLARADQCAAQALRVTDSRDGGGNSSHDNTYAAERVGNSTAVATGFGTGGATGFLSERDTFVGDSSAVAFDWDGGENLIFRECKFGRGAHAGRDFVTFSFRNGKNFKVSGIRFIDSVFEKGTEPTSTDMKAIGANGDWPGPAEYFIDWTLALVAQDSQKRPLGGADISITDVFGHPAFHGQTDSQGRVSVPLSELRVYNTLTNIVRERQTPHKVQVTKRGCVPAAPNYSLCMDKTTSLNVTLDCKPD